MNPEERKARLQAYYWTTVEAELDEEEEAEFERWMNELVEDASRAVENERASWMVLDANYIPWA